MVAAAGTGYSVALTQSQQAAAVPALARTIREMESGGSYTIRNKNCKSDCTGAGCAGGAYQYLTSTWAGFGGYRCPHAAPASIQDQRAFQDIATILAANGGRIWAVPTTWYIGSFDPARMDTVPMPELGNNLTPRAYGLKWLAKASGYLDQIGIDIWPQVTEGVADAATVANFMPADIPLPGPIPDIPIPGLDDIPIIGGVLSAAADIPGAIAQMASVLKDGIVWVVKAGVWLANPTNWLRILQVLGGAGLVAGGTAILARDTIAGVAAMAPGPVGAAGKAASAGLAVADAAEGAADAVKGG